MKIKKIQLAMISFCVFVFCCSVVWEDAAVIRGDAEGVYRVVAHVFRALFSMIGLAVAFSVCVVSLLSLLRFGQRADSKPGRKRSQTCPVEKLSPEKS